MKKLQIIVAMALLAAGTFGATTASADQLVLEGQILGVVSQDQGFSDLSGEAGSGGVGLIAGYRLGAVPEVSVLVSYHLDGMSGQRFGNQVGVDWARHRLLLGGEYGLDFLDGRLRPLARLGVGYSGQKLAMRVDGVEYQDRGHGFAVQAQGGAEVGLTSAQSTSPLSVGANFLMGYLWQTPASFGAMSSTSAPEEPTEEDPWSRATYDAGSLSASGVTWNLGVTLRYRL